MKIYKTKYVSLGYGRIYAGAKIESYDSLLDLVKNDYVLEEWLRRDILALDDEEEMTEELLKEHEDDILGWYNEDNEVLNFCDYAESEEEFIAKNFDLLEDIKSDCIEQDTIYAFRNYQYSQNKLLAKFKGFKSIEEVKQYCIENDIVLGEFTDKAYEFNNTYFLDGKHPENFGLEELEILYSAGDLDIEYDVYTK